MKRTEVASPLLIASILGSLLGVAASAHAGPPLVCHAIDIGQARSLPWPSNLGNLSGNPDYDLKNLVSDTLTILTSNAPVLVRMETLRRATLYARRNPIVAKQLLMRLYQRATSAESAGQSDALAWFDVGYLAACYQQWNEAVHEGLGRGSEATIPVLASDGYDWVKKALSLRGQDPEMEFAAALITLHGPQRDHEEHVEKAKAGVKSDPLLAQNLASHII